MVAGTHAIDSLVSRIRLLPDCTVHAPVGLPLLREPERLPEDLARFYSLCGGVALFAGADYAIDVVGPSDFVRSNIAIRGCDDATDISSSWYIVARAGAQEAISVDCSSERLGRCYDSFWDVHAIAGSSAIVALSFTELLTKLVAGEGGHWYWLADPRNVHGDAYDGIRR